MTVRTIDEIFRDFVTDGVPASGPFNPHKPDIRDTLKALTEGSENFPDNRVIRLNNADEGTANNIVVTASVAIPAAAYQVLYILNVTQENTGPVTVSGAINRDLVTNLSQPIAPGYLIPGMALLCIDTGTELRLLSYGDAEAILAAAEEAADRAEDAAAAAEAAAGGLLSNFASRSEVVITNIPALVSYLRTAGYYAPGDGGGALYKRALTEPTHAGKIQSADGAWWEYVIEGSIVAAQFGVGIGSNDHAAATTALFDFANGREVVFQPGTYNYSSPYTAPVGSRAFFPGAPGNSVVYSANRISGLTRRYNYRREGTKGTSWQEAKPRLGSISEAADVYFLDSFQKQWSVSPTYWQWSDYESGVHKEWNQNSDVSPNGWPQASFVGSAVSMPGNKDFPAGMHMLGFTMGNGGSVWGWNSIVGNNTDVQVAGGSPRFLCGGEIDMQPSQGSDLTSSQGAGLLVNSFWTHVPFAAIAIAGDAGGAWKQGVWVTGIQSNGAILATAPGLSCLSGIDLSEASFSGAAIAIRNDDPILFKTSGGTNGSFIEGDGAGNLHVRLAQPNTSMKVHASNDDDNVEVFSVETMSSTFQGPVLRTANGAAPNTAAAAIWTRANNTTNRSINAGGTINASGADYAEYEYKSDDCATIEKGQIVGFTNDGHLTDKFSEAISFAVKSTRPNLVGGDTWMEHLGERPVEPKFRKTVVWNGGTKPVYTRVRPHDETDKLMEKWQANYDKYLTEEAAELQTFLDGEYAEWQKANAEYELRLEAARSKVDRIAYCGKVPVNIFGASVGQHVIPSEGEGDTISVVLVNDDSITFEQYKLSIGRVRRILPDGRAEIVVKPI